MDSSIEQATAAPGERRFTAIKPRLATLECAGRWRVKSSRYDQALDKTIVEFVEVDDA